MGKTLQDHHNDGQEDAAEGSGYNVPHGQVEKLVTWSNDGMQKIADENNAYKSGYEHGKSQK